MATKKQRRKMSEATMRAAGHIAGRGVSNVTLQVLKSEKAKEMLPNPRLKRFMQLRRKGVTPSKAIEMLDRQDAK